MKIKPPFALSTITQGFAQNATSTYAASGLKGHTGIDFGVAWGTPIPITADASYCYSTMSKDNPNLMAYRAVFTIVEDGDNCYEISYGHCSEMSAVPGATYQTGDTIAEIGNTGDVFVGNTKITNEQKMAGSHAGAHLHFQVRLLKKVPRATLDGANHKYVNDGNGLLVVDGFVYEVPFWDNGYNGCLDPQQFFTDTIPSANPTLGTIITTTLSASDQVAVLAAKKMADGNTYQANILFALAAFIKAFGK